jgi:hypothetical protein
MRVAHVQAGEPAASELSDDRVASQLVLDTSSGRDRLYALERARPVAHGSRVLPRFFEDGLFGSPNAARADRRATTLGDRRDGDSAWHVSYRERVWRRPAAHTGRLEPGSFE